MVQKCLSRGPVTFTTSSLLPAWVFWFVFMKWSGRSVAHVVKWCCPMASEMPENQGKLNFPKFSHKNWPEAYSLKSVVGKCLPCITWKSAATFELGNISFQGYPNRGARQQTGDKVVCARKVNKLNSAQPSECAQKRNRNIGNNYGTFWHRDRSAFWWWR